MITFTQHNSTFLIEGKNTHMEHIEDSLFNDGASGAVDAVRFLKSVTEMLSGNSKRSFAVTVKWDGAPAVFAGKNPENGKFFVATKSLFNKVPKVNYTNADIDENHSGGLADKLKTCLQHLKKLNIRGILQGDLLYTQDDLNTKDFDGESHYTFKPNTIMYAVPVDSELGNIIKKSTIGIVFHTAYEGNSLQDLTAVYDPTISTLKNTPSVWFTDADFRDESGSSTLTAKETKTMNGLIKAIEKNMKSTGKKNLDLVSSDEMIKTYVKTFVNANIRVGKDKHSAKEFIAYVSDKYDVAIDKLKSEKGKTKKQAEKDKILLSLTSNEKKLESLFKLHYMLNAAKMVIIDKLEQAKSIGTFLETEDGLQTTAPEGFVAVDRISNNALKLVNRLEFSKANFTVSKDWVKG